MHRYIDVRVHIENLIVLVIQLAFATRATGAFMIKSTGTGGWATGFDYSASDQSYLISGTLYADGFWGISPLLGGTAPDDKFQCFITQVFPHSSSNIGNVPRVSRAFAEPEICVGGIQQTYKEDDDGLAAVMGTLDDGSASVQLLSKQPIEPSTKFNLPSQTIPVASARRDDGRFLYVAIHSTGGWTIPREATSTSANANNLKGLTELYWLPLTDPRLTENTMVQIRKYDTSSPEEMFIKDMDLESSSSGGKAVVAAVEHYSNTNNAGSFVIVAGSTNGRGEMFGTPPDFLGGNSHNDLALGTNPADDNNWDGYVTWLNDDKDGELVQSLRLNVNPGVDDNVRGICRHRNFLFVVGTSWGSSFTPEGSLRGPHAFIMKIDLVGRHILWTFKEGLDGQQGIKCVADSSTVYLASYKSKSYVDGNLPVLSQNIVVTKYSAGPVQTKGWSQEIDSTIPSSDIRQDYIVGLELGPDGNIVALINSINYRQGLNDIILLDYDKDTGRNDLRYEPNNPDKKDPYEDERDPTGDLKNVEEEEKSAIIIVAIFLPVIFCIVIICCQIACSSVAPVDGQKEDMDPPMTELSTLHGINHEEQEVSARQTAGEDTLEDREIV